MTGPVGLNKTLLRPVHVSVRHGGNGDYEVPDGWTVVAARWTPSDPKYMSSEYWAGTWDVLLQGTGAT